LVQEGGSGEKGGYNWLHNGRELVGWSRVEGM